MQITAISPAAFYKLCYRQPNVFLKRVASQEAFIVKALFDKQLVQRLRSKTFEWGQASEASWHPLIDGCPDYHRLHDNYPQAYVKQKLHAFYRHGYAAENKPLFDAFAQIFDLKMHLCQFTSGPPLSVNNKPSDFVVARLNIHHYPQGGGYQAMHIDPDNPWAAIQTLIAASDYGADYHTGGVYAVPDESGEEVFLDPHLEPGDMLVMTPAIRHGVAPIDPEQSYSPQTNNGRWMILPIFVHSDYPREQNIKPQQVG